MSTIGFTGTQNGMTKEQSQKFDSFLASTDGMIFRHGGCIGADEQAHYITLDTGLKIIVHPGVNKNGVAAKRGTFVGAHEILEEKFYLDRNKDIVNNADMMIATPAEFEEQERGGTWSTIRYARRVDIPLAIILPDGSLTI